MPKENSSNLFSYSTMSIKLPPRNPEIWAMYQKAIESWWHPRSIPLHTDVEEWATSLSTAEKHLLSRIMAFFASSNCVITDKATNSLSVEYSNLEAKFFFDLQTASENIHAETYAHLLKNLIEDDRQRDDILNSSTMLSSVLEQNAWANKWLRRDYGSIGNRMTAMLCVKGIFFQSMFAVLCWFRFQGKLPGLTRTNDLIMKDSAMHAHFGYHMLSLIEDRPGRDLTTKIVKEAVKIEVRFIEKAFNLIVVPGLELESIVQYVKFVADRILSILGYEVYYNVENSLSYVDEKNANPLTVFADEEDDHDQMDAHESFKSEV